MRRKKNHEKIKLFLGDMEDEKAMPKRPMQSLLGQQNIDNQAKHIHTH